MPGVAAGVGVLGQLGAGGRGAGVRVGPGERLRSKVRWGYDGAFTASCREELTVRPPAVGERRTAPAERDGRVPGFTTVDGQPPEGAVGMMGTLVELPTDARAHGA
ncbi:hypothetical protein [Streptomyces albogriseolus]|uniref:hypothetical protein n=1 Tax=Streptomyces albogriseolus TaxID=1887 RepID=UPI003F53FDE5